MQERKEYRYLDQLTERYPCLSAIRPELEKAYETLRECYAKGGKLLAAGNGGSCGFRTYRGRTDEGLRKEKRAA